MKNVYFSFCLLLIISTANAQYWQQTVHYNIDVALQAKEKSLTGFAEITYINNSPDTLNYIWFHLWPNAYKNDQTAFSNQALDAGKTDFYFSTKEQKGYINRLDFKVNGITAKTEDHPQHIDIVKLVLPTPLQPGSQTKITTPFHVKLPYNFSRGGWDGNSFQVTQWYPKAAMYDASGWHPMPYLDLGEYYSNFGNYSVKITVPENYVVAATGQLQTRAEMEWLKTRVNYETQKPPIAKKTYGPKKSSNTLKGKTDVLDSANKRVKTLHFIQQQVHDFAFFANPDFIVNSDTCQLPSGKVVEVYSYYTPAHKNLWKWSVQYTKDALRFYSSEVGEYPYQTASIVQGPQSFGGGMEYPTITVISPVASAKDLDVIIAHEIGHNWFQGVLATNERAHPWMDEGFNSFYEKKYTRLKYGAQPQWEEVLFRTKAHFKKDQPIATHSTDFEATNYLLTSYQKTAQWLSAIEKEMGEQKFKQMMQAYFKTWQFKHPQPEDFKILLQQNLLLTDSSWAQLYQTGLLPHQQSKGFTVVSALAPATISHYLRQPAKDVLLISPAVGYNKYDGLMLGGIISNYKLPPNKLQYLAIPLYATTSKQLNGIGKISYRTFPQGIFQQFEFGLLGSRFSKSHQLDSNRQKVFETFYKVSPSIKATFRSDVKDSREAWLEARSFIIGEKDFSHFTIKSTDSLFYVDSIETASRYINQLTYGVQNYRTLYPYNYQLQLQQGKGFYRVNFTGNYFFNYAKSGGANVRWFAGFFGYLGNGKNNFATARYQPKLLGVTGEEDFTYSNYFAGRTASVANDNSTIDNSGLAAQQIMIRDGGFKLRLDQFDFLQGRSQKWVAALNFNSTLPQQLLPFKNPFKVFLDVGTFREAWNEDATISRFLFVGGLQLSLFKNALNIYAPLIYSSDFKENLKALPEQNTFAKKLTFSIDFSQLTLKNLTNNQFSF